MLRIADQEIAGQVRTLMTAQIATIPGGADETGRVMLRPATGGFVTVIAVM
jgi:hypothetical protein